MAEGEERKTMNVARLGKNSSWRETEWLKCGHTYMGMGHKDGEIVTVRVSTSDRIVRMGSPEYQEAKDGGSIPACECSHSTMGFSWVLDGWTLA